VLKRIYIEKAGACFSIRALSLDEVQEGSKYPLVGMPFDGKSLGLSRRDPRTVMRGP
jgi:hypothetical protein